MDGMGLGGGLVGGIGGGGWQTNTDSPTMNDDGVVLSLFQQVLFFLLSLIIAENFPLEAIALLPPLLRRKLFLLLPILNLHRIERQCPVATEGITMEKVWEELFNERLCKHTKWVAEPHSLKLIVDDEHCNLGIGSNPLGMNIMKGLLGVVLVVPLTEDFTQIRVRGFEQIKGRICHYLYCQDTQNKKFYCSPKHIHLFPENQYHNETNVLKSTVLEVVTVLLEHCPLEVSSLSIGTLIGVPSVNLEDIEFCRLLNHVHTLEVQVPGYCYYNIRDEFPLQSCRGFIEALLNVFVSNPDSALQNLHLDMYSSSHSKLTMRYYHMLIEVIGMFFSPVSTRSDVVPFLKLKKLRIATKLLKSEEIGKVVDVINHQEDLEVLELSSKTTQRRYPNPAHNALFQAAGKCFLKPTFQCLTLKDFHVATSAFLDLQHHFLVSFVRREQKLILKDTKIYSSGDRKNVSCSSENAACTKSLSVLKCSVTDVGIFSTADIASGILSHPGTKYVDMSGSLDHMDLHKLTASLEKGAGTLRLLDLSDTDLSTIIVRVGPLLDAIFHLPHLDELELVLKGCRLQRKDLEQLYCRWEQESCGRKLRNRSCGQSLRKLCVCGNRLPKDKSNLQLMAHSLCHHACSQ